MGVGRIHKVRGGMMSRIRDRPSTPGLDMSDINRTKTIVEWGDPIDVLEFFSVSKATTHCYYLVGY